MMTNTRNPYPYNHRWLKRGMKILLCQSILFKKLGNKKCLGYLCPSNTTSGRILGRNWGLFSLGQNNPIELPPSRTKEIIDGLCRDYSIPGNNIVVGSMTPASDVRGAEQTKAEITLGLEAVP